MPRLLPLFPLQLVVFPRTQLPLHIFEARYKEVVGEAIAQNSEFGVVLATNDGIVNAGCTVTVDKVLTTYPDGSLDIVTNGVRRFEILALDHNKAYLQGQVEFFNDEDLADVPLTLRLEVLERFWAMLEAGNQRSYPEPVLSDPQLSFQLAQVLEDLDFQSVILRTRSETDRLKQISQFLHNYIPRLKATTRMKQLAPLNGHKPAGL
jgi:Lon protease-like protein